MQSLHDVLMNSTLMSFHTYHDILNVIAEIHIGIQITVIMVNRLDKKRKGRISNEKSKK